MLVHLHLHLFHREIISIVLKPKKLVESVQFSNNNPQTRKYPKVKSNSVHFPHDSSANVEQVHRQMSMVLNSLSESTNDRE